MRPAVLFPPLLALLVGCAVNPVTGERQFVLISESREIEMGRQADQDIVRSLGLLDDASWQAYVQELGETMVRRSERPDLPWTFRVVDDPVVNAFALPGGFIYLTRGILAHFSSEAELAGVLGHEVGHVTARHSVNRISRAQLAQLGLGVGSILRPELTPWAEAAEAGLELLFLSYGREDEREADDLGLRYMTGQGYDPREMAETFRMLADASGAREGGRVPAFLASHPDPLERRDRILQRVAQGEFSGNVIRREAYLNRLDGMPFGPDPRQGYFEEDGFFHPELAFRLDFPAGWQTRNGREAVQGVSPEQDAAVVLTPENAPSPRAGLDSFLAADGVTGSNASLSPVNGLEAARSDFSTHTNAGPVAGAAAFIRHEGRVYRILGYALQSNWRAQSDAIRRSVSSFRPVTDPAVLGRGPDRVEMVRISAQMTLQSFNQRYPSSVPLETVATINHLDPAEPIPAGTLLKRILSGAR